MSHRLLAGSSVAISASTLSLLVMVACSADRTTDVPERGEAPEALNAVAPARLADPATPAMAATPRSATLASLTPNYYAGPPDTSRSTVQRGPLVARAHAESSLPFSMLPQTIAKEVDHEVGKLPNRPASLPSLVDPVLQSHVPIQNLPATIVKFPGQGNTNTPATVTGTPPDTNGAVGPNHYVQVVNGGIAIWNKTGTMAGSARLVNALFTGYAGTNAGNSCAADNDGDPVVVYDQIADRWFITQFSLPNSNSGPNFQCVAVSKTADPTGAYWLYDFQYPGLNDYGKFGVWPDAYYATFNMFNSSGGAADICAYDRVAMLAGQTATQQCFQQGGNFFGVLPISMDGKITPPRGEPGFFLAIGQAANSLDLWKLHVDWKTPASSALTGPTSIPVAAFTSSSGTPSAGGVTLDDLADRLMFRLSYRNFGTHEALLANHTVVAGATGGVRWYEIRSPNETPVVFQQGTYGPADGSYRWMASLAQDQAEDVALGFSSSSPSTNPSIGWTGRLGSDPAGQMPQGETVFENGTAVESGATRWGDYSNMTVDPTDDCTFWYTTELYHTAGTATWDTAIASVKFPSCAANDFTITPAPATQNIAPGHTATFTVTSAKSAGTAESLALAVQDLPSGVTGAFSPTSVTAGGSSTLTLTATSGAPLTATPTTFMVIGKAPSAVHAATAQVVVANCTPLTTCPAGDNCGTVSDTCGGNVTCGTCTAPQTCGGGGKPNVCGCTAGTKCPAGQTCGTAPDGCGGTINCGGCTPPQTCGGGPTPVCGCTPITKCPAADSCGTMTDGCGGTLTCAATCSAPQTCGGGGTPNKCGSGGPNGDNNPPGTTSGCGCRTADSRGAPSWPLLGLGGLIAIAAVRSRRRTRG